MLYKLVTILCCCAISLCASAQLAYPLPWVEWGKLLRAGFSDCLIALEDGALIAGQTQQDPLDPLMPPEAQPHPLGSLDSFVVRVDARGNTLWMKRLGSTSNDVTLSLAALSDGGCVVLAGAIYNGPPYPPFTAGYGEANETELAGGDCYIAALGPDGLLRWVQPVSLDARNVAVSPDGTAYVYCARWFTEQLVFARGTTQEVIIDADGALACYGSSGTFQWAVPTSGGWSALTALPGSCVLFRAEDAELKQYGTNGEVLWTKSLPHDPEWLYPAICTATGTAQFYVLCWRNNVFTLKKFDGATTPPAELWSRTKYDDQHPPSLGVRPDGSGMILLQDIDWHSIITFTSEGVLSPLKQMWLGEGVWPQSYIAPVPGTEDGFYACGGFSYECTLGVGQPNEVHLATTGDALMLGQFHIEPQPAKLQITVIGRGNVALDPPGGSYEYGTEVSLHAAPNFPNHDEFVLYMEDLASTNPDETIIMDSHKYVTAVFEELPDAPPLPAASVVGLAALAAALCAAALLARSAISR